MTWIWLPNGENISFAEFQLPFDYLGDTIELRISADYQYAAYIGDRMVSCGQYADLPSYKCVNKADLSPFVQPGPNILRVVAWHMGNDFSVCRTMPAAVAFEIVRAGQIIARSDGNTLCRAAVGYRTGDQITPQLGRGFAYDFTAPAQAWQTAQVVDVPFIEAERPIRQTVVEAPCPAQITAQGIFHYRGGATAAEQMQAAWMATLPFEVMTGKDRRDDSALASPLTFTAQEGDGLFAVVDLGQERCGHLHFCLTVDRPCTLLVGFGEHLADLRLRTAVGGRNFALCFRLQAGENVFDDYLLRLGCRYLCLFAEAHRLEIGRLSLREVSYPFAFPQKEFGDRLLNAIYETGRRTLSLCAHQHYEDCPWREQALYGFDSRNQMLFGYGTFAEYDYPRANLLLMARAQQENGLIPLTAPAQMSITIPSFTAYWLIAIGENGEADYNEAFLSQILPYASRAIDTLLLQEGEHGLSLFTGPEAWNFHEWSPGLSGGEIFRQESIPAMGDAGLTALTAIAAAKLAPLARRLGQTVLACTWEAAAARLRSALNDYYDSERALYASYRKGNELEGYHEAIQAIILCAGGLPRERALSLCRRLRDPRQYGLVPATLSALQMKYQALLTYLQDIDFCIEDIVRRFGKMLLEGATSYYETEAGEADFADAGSLCHGWSAVCCWVLDQIPKKQ